MEKRPAEAAANGDADGSSSAKKAKKDPDCGLLLFCGSTNWEAVSSSNPIRHVQVGHIYLKWQIYQKSVKYCIVLFNLVLPVLS
jgi:hypothetical protein